MILHILRDTYERDEKKIQVVSSLLLVSITL